MNDQPQTAIQVSKSHLRGVMFSDRIIERFEQALGRPNVRPYISSVLLAVAQDEKLQECTELSIIASALKCAALGLRVDPEVREAYLVPFKDNKKNIMKATLIIHYMGLYNMAVKTGLYRYINVAEIYEGQNVVEAFPSGFHSITGNKTSDVVVGLIGAFEMLSGFAKTVYMSLEEIHAHAKKHSRSYGSSWGMWTKNPPLMEKKTLYRVLLGWAIKSSGQQGKLGEALDADEMEVGEDIKELEAEVIDGEATEKPKQSPKDLSKELGYEYDEDKPKPTKAVVVEATPEALVVEGLPASELVYTKEDMPKSNKDWKKYYTFLGKFLSKDELKEILLSFKPADAIAAFEQVVKQEKIALVEAPNSEGVENG